jgi:hypothetical protein
MDTSEHPMREKMLALLASGVNVAELRIDKLAEAVGASPARRNLATVAYHRKVLDGRGLLELRD